jgi:hypothetical protein
VLKLEKNWIKIQGMDILCNVCFELGVFTKAQNFKNLKVYKIKS